MYNTYVQQYVVREPVWFICDKSNSVKYGRNSAKEYFDKNYAVFLKRVKDLKGAAKVSANDEKELKFMFEELIWAKREATSE